MVDAEHVFWSGIEFIGGEVFVVHAVFFSTDYASLDFEDNFILGSQDHEFLGDFHVLIQGKFGAIEHMAVE